MLSNLTQVSDLPSNFAEQLDYYAEHLTAPQRRQVFKEIYSGHRKPRYVSELNSKTRLGIIRVAQEAAKLADIGLLAKGRNKNPSTGKSETFYEKRPEIAVHRVRLLKLAESPKARKELATKRRPLLPRPIEVPVRVRGTPRKQISKQKLRVLYLLANPASQESLRTDAEFRLVQDEVRGSKHRAKIELIISPAADTKSILNGINDHRPQIVHFSGHGGNNGIWLDDGKVHKSIGRSMGFDLLTETLSATTAPPRLLVLNACDTLAGAKRILEAVEVVIAMSDSISDIGAATFAAQFYAAIASAQPISAALKQGILAMKAASLTDAHLPQMVFRKGVDPKKIVLVSAR